MFGIGPVEMMIIGGIAVLLFGKKLPEVARSVGSSYQQFRKGLTDIQSEMHDVTNTTYSAATDYNNNSAYNANSAGDRQEIDEHDVAAAPKFEPPAADTEDDA